jgi:pyruvate dehydrogenase E1 component alpha subunit
MVEEDRHLWQAATAECNLALTTADKLCILTDMVRARVFEQQALKYYKAGQMGGWLMLTIGQEGTAAAVRSMLSPEDHTISGVRGLGFAVMRGISMRECMAELMGKRGGSSKGKGGMFSFFSPERHHWGIHGLAAAHTPLAAGFAFAMKRRNQSGVAVCLMGDGAMNQGVFHETLNLAGLFSLPVIYIVENNGYSMGTSVMRSSACKDYLGRRAEMYDMDWDHCGGHDIYAVRACLHSAMRRAREHQRPTLLEISTYRYYGFTIADANHKKYRTDEEIEWHRANRDPVNLWLRRLIAEGVATEELHREIHGAAKNEAAEAVVWARAQPVPEICEICGDVYWETDHATAASRIGHHFFNDA